MKRSSNNNNYNNNRSNFNDLLALLGLGLSFYVAYINTQNTEYNRQQVTESSNISKELKRLNESQLMHNIQAQLDREDCQRENEKK